MKALLTDLLAAFQFLTRFPLPATTAEPDLSRAATFFPLVGCVVGIIAAFAHRALAAHLPGTVAALFTVLLLVLMTGGLHEDGLADVADAFGASSDRQRILDILKDSRIGSYGALALLFSVLARTLLLAALPSARAFSWLVTAQVLCRWTALPLASALSPARGPMGQGARLARRLSWLSLGLGTLFALLLSAWLLRGSLGAPWIAALSITALSAAWYSRRIGGITGDCYGATNQLVEIAVYLCGVWQ